MADERIGGSRGELPKSTRNNIGHSDTATATAAAAAADLWKVHLGMVLVQVGYGGSYVLNKVALTNGVNPVVFAVYRDVICLIVLIPVAYFSEKGKRGRLTGEVFLLLLGLGFFGAFITQLLSLYGVFLTNAAYAATISILTPLFTFIISTAFRFEQIRLSRADGQAKLGGLLGAVIGAVVLAVYLGPVILGYAVYSDGGDAATIPMSGLEPSEFFSHTLMLLKLGPWQLGVLCLFFAGFTLSISISIQVPILSRYPAPITVSAFAYLLGAIMLLTTALLTVSEWSALVVTERSAVISYIYNGLVPAAFNFTVLIWCVQKAGPVLVASYTPLQLFSAGAMGYLFLGESIHLGSLLGTIMIIAGLGFITWGQIRSRTLAALPVKATPPLQGVPVATAIASNLEEPLLG